MGSLRLVLAVVLLVASAAAAGAAYVALRESPGGAGEHGVRVIGPQGLVFEGEVRVDEATALSVLLAAGRMGGFKVEVAEYPGMGAYVWSIAGHEARGASGWVYEVVRDGATRNGDRSAALQPLQPGDAVTWRWTDG